MRLLRALVGPALLLLAPAALAQTSTATTTGDAALEAKIEALVEARVRATLKEQVKEELREELKASIKSELAAEAAMSGAQPEEGWAEEEWKWEEPAKPTLDFLQFDGYFRFRYDFFHNLDLDTYYNNTLTGQESGPFSPGFAPPVAICATDPRCAAARDSIESLGSANMRLRLEPTLNVYEDIKIKMQIDILDNLVLGTTPDGFPINPISPLLGFSQTQISPSDGTNALFDSIRVKRVWAEVMTPLGQLRAGRMPSHFGMGLLANEGQGIDSDFGDSNDRIMFATKIAGHYVVPAFDWTASGPTSQIRGISQGQPFDRDQRDDVDQYILAIAKRDKDQEIKEMLDHGEWVLNYGVYGVYRVQALDSGSYYKNGDPGDGAGTKDLITRGLTLGAYSLWTKLMYDKLELELEHVGIIGSVDNTAAAGTYSDPPSKSVEVQMFALAVRGQYKLLHDALTLHLLGVFASGDDAPGWGVTPLATAPNAGDWDGGQDADGKINNFRVDPDFRVDMIFWRQLVGVITDAIIIKPGIQYNVTEAFGGRFDLIYSRAVYAESTPSASIAGQAPDANLGLEGNLKLFYDADDGFHAWLEYGVFFPFGGLDRQVVDPRNQRLTLPSGVAQSIQAMLAVTF